MKQPKFISAALMAGGLLVLASDTFAQAPPAPRPFKVHNPDGTYTTVAPNTGGRLKMLESDLPANKEPEKPVNFLTNSAPRDTKTGYYVGGMLGFNIDSFQGSNFNNWFNDGVLFKDSPRIYGLDTDDNMSLGPMAALKFGYVWPFGDAIDQFENETGGLRLAGALEGEFVYFHGFHEYGPGGGPLNSEVQAITFAPMVNALLKGYWGRSEVYAGVGIGIAMTIFAGDGGSAPDEESLGDLAYQFILGYEFHMNREWSIFTEAKYFTVDELSYISSDDVSNVLLGIGVKKQLF